MTDTAAKPATDAKPAAKPKVLESAGKAFDNAKDTARRTADAASENPLALLAGGIALGVLIGVLLPRSQRERELLDPLGQRLADGANAAAKAAREAGKAELDAVLPSADTAREKVSALFGNVLEAAKGSGRGE